VPACLAILPAVALLGTLIPWPAGGKILSRYADQTPIMISFSIGSSSTRDKAYGDWTTTKHDIRSFVLFPSFMTHPKIFTVYQINDDAPTLTESSASMTLISLGLMYAFGAVCVWWFWLRPRRQG
jgi:hypothetical protein